MKKHLFLTALVLALVMCFSFGALAADPEKGYVNDYKTTGLDNKVTDGNVTIMTVKQWRAEANAEATKTFFDGGEALADDDIIIKNKEAAIVLAVGTRNPWGYPNGSVLDAGVVKDGKGYRDTTWSIEFLANWWDSWAPGNGCGKVLFDIVKYDFDKDGKEETAVRVTRNYDLAGNYGAEGENNDKDLSIVTYYGAPQEGPYLYMFDGIENVGDDAVWYNGYEGYTGYQGTADGYENLAFSVTNKGDDGAATFGKGMAYPAVGSYANTIGKEGHKDFQGEYLTSFTIPAKEFKSNLGNTFAVSGNGGKSGYQELYITNVSNEEVEASGNRKMFDKGEKVQVEAYIVCSDKADHAVLNEFVFEQTGVATYPVAIEGIEGATGTMEVIVTSDDGKYGWYTLNAKDGGEIKLPAGEYTFKFEKAGYFVSDEVELTIGFTDIPAGKWYDDEIITIQAAEIIKGYPDGSFGPENAVTRAEFAVMLYRYLGQPELAKDAKPIAFTDLEDYAWAKEAIDYLSANEIIKGIGNDMYAPAAEIKRADICVMLDRVLNANMKKVVFTDVKASTYYYDAVMSMANAGYINGFGDGTFKPEESATRAQVATIFSKLPNVDKVFAAAAELGAERIAVTVNVLDADTDKATYGRVAVYNEKGIKYENSLYPTVRYIGDSVFYSKDAANKGITVEIPKGEACTLEVMGEGYWFTSKPVEKKIAAADAVAGKVFNVEVKQDAKVQDGYIGGDVHHHTNKNDAFALPEDIVRSYLASGLDVVSTTDHDYTVNNQRTYNFIKDSIGTDLLGYMPSVEISCSWAHFNVVPMTTDAWNYYVDASVTNSPVKDKDGTALAFTNLPYFLKDVNDHGASLTANHPWYSYGLFTALGSDAIPGGYTDGYDMIGLNGSYRDQEMSKTIVSGFDLWDGYIEYIEDGKGTAEINKKEVPVASTHYYAGGSDTHDVLTPYASNLTSFALNERVRENREEFFTGKVRSYAAVQTTAGEYAQNAIDFGKAMVNGNSYTTTGPILTLDKVPGNNANGEINKYALTDGAFKLNVGIDSLTGIRDILVLTSDAKGNYNAYTGKANENPLGVRFYRQFALTHVDEDLSIANGITAAETDPTVCAIPGKTGVVNEYNFELKYVPQTEGLHWVAVCVVDIYGNFAVTNAYWVEK
ncbi:MAG: S-layer homology domain-containing protein [Firmicutes bacterium]|nr:S-layer homology domain-containing protein [Bacillota bacterium]